MLVSASALKTSSRSEVDSVMAIEPENLLLKLSGFVYMSVALILFDVAFVFSYHWS